MFNNNSWSVYPPVLAHLGKLVFHTIHKCTVHISPPSVSLRGDGTKEVSESKHVLSLIVVYLFLNCYLIIFALKTCSICQRHILLFWDIQGYKTAFLVQGRIRTVVKVCFLNIFWWVDDKASLSGLLTERSSLNGLLQMGWDYLWGKFLKVFRPQSTRPTIFVIRKENPKFWIIHCSYFKKKQRSFWFTFKANIFHYIANNKWKTPALK